MMGGPVQFQNFEIEICTKVVISLENVAGEHKNE